MVDGDTHVSTAWRCSNNTMFWSIKLLLNTNPISYQETLMSENLNKLPKQRWWKKEISSNTQKGKRNLTSSILSFFLKATFFLCFFFFWRRPTATVSPTAPTTPTIPIITAIKVTLESSDVSGPPTLLSTASNKTISSSDSVRYATRQNDLLHHSTQK